MKVSKREVRRAAENGAESCWLSAGGREIDSGRMEMTEEGRARKENDLIESLNVDKYKIIIDQINVTKNEQ